MVRDLSQHFASCSINTATLGFQAPIAEVIEAVAQTGFGMIAPWRREVEGGDVKAIARHIRDAGLSLSGYCRSTYIPAATTQEFQHNITANKRALDDAATLGAPVFVMVVGGMPQGSKDMAAARAQVQEATSAILPYAKSVGVKLALEPLHPVYAADRSCLTLLSEALDWCDAIEGAHASPSLGVAIDAYHVWWDPALAASVARAGKANRIFAYHVCDWLVPTTDVLNDRGMMGDGVIDLKALRHMVDTAGYQGAVETEIFSANNWWKRPMAETLAVCRERLLSAT
jgi:sugar phosphate isomerase/epimerase